MNKKTKHLQVSEEVHTQVKSLAVANRLKIDEMLQTMLYVWGRIDDEKKEVSIEQTVGGVK